MSEIRVEEDRLHIDSFSISDSDIVTFFEAIPSEDYEPKLIECLKIGVVALRTARTAENVEYVERRFDRLSRTFTENLTTTLESIEERLEAFLGEEGTLANTFNEYLGDEGSLATIIDSNFGDDGRLVRDVFDPTSPGTPLFQLRSLISDDITTLRTDLRLEEAVEEERNELVERTTLHGYDFEDACEPILEEIVRARMGDELERTVNTPGILTGRTVGDFVITLHDRPDCKIVLETKAMASVSLPEIHRQMEESMENRGAQYGIFVVRNKESLPGGVGCFNEYHGTHLVCVLSTEEDEGQLHPEILEMAVFWARNRVLMEVIEGEDIDVQLVSAHLESIKTNIARFRNIRTQCTNAETALRKIRDLSDSIQEDINASLGIIQAEIVRVTDQEEGDTEGE
jgi:hypothetical protein